MTDASRTIKVTVVGDADSLQRALGKTDESLSRTNNSLGKHGAAHKGAAGEAKSFEQALHAGSSTIGLYGENVEGLSRKLGGMHSLMGSGLGLGAAGLVGAAALGGGVEAVKAAIENSEKQEQALAALHQAADVAGVSYDGLRKKTLAYVDANGQFIGDQYQAINAMATFTRAGLDETQATDAMNIAIDLAAIKQIPLTEAARGVQMAMMGSGHAVRELGIDLKSLSKESDVTEQATTNVEAAQKKSEASALHLATAQRSLKEFEDSLHGKRVLSQIDLDHLKDKQTAVAAAEKDDLAAKTALKAAEDELGVSTAKRTKILEELKQKTEGGRDATTKLQRSQNELKHDWEDLTATGGPALIQTLDAVAKAADNVLRGAAGKGDAQKGWDGLNNVLVTAAHNLHGVATGTTTTGEAQQKGGRWAQTYGEAQAAAAQSTNIAQLAAHALSERLDRQTDSAVRAASGAGRLREGNEAADKATASFGRQVAQATRHEDELAQSMGRSSAATAVSIEGVRMYGRGLDEMKANAGKAEEANAFMAAHTQQGIQNIREVIAQANKDRLEVKVDAGQVDALRSELQSIFNAQYSLHFSSEHGDMGGGSPDAGGHGYARGTPFVPEDQVAQLHRGEMVVPAAQAAAIRRGTATLGGVGGGHTFNINVTAGAGSDGDAIGQAVARQVRRELALRGL